MPFFIKINEDSGEKTVSTETQKVLQNKGESRKRLVAVAAKASLQKLKTDSTGAKVPDGEPTDIEYADLPEPIKNGLFAAGDNTGKTNFILPEVIGSVDNLQLAPHKLYENSYDELKSTLVNMFRALKAFSTMLVNHEKYIDLAESLLLQLESVGKTKFDKARDAYVAAYSTSLKAGHSATQAGGIAMKYAARTAPGYRHFHAMVWMNRKVLNTKDIEMKLPDASDSIMISPYNLGLMLERSVQAGLDVEAAYQKAAVAYKTESSKDARKSLIALGFTAKDVRSQDERYKATRLLEIEPEDDHYGLNDTHDTFTKVRDQVETKIMTLTEILDVKVPSGFTDVTNDDTKWKDKTKIISAVSGLRLRKNPKSAAKVGSLSKGEAVTLVLDSSKAVQSQIESGITYYKVKDAKGNEGWVAYKDKSGKNYIKAQNIKYTKVTTM